MRDVQSVGSMPQPLAVDSGAAETARPRTWFPNHKKVESEGSKRGVFHTTADGSTVENEGKKTPLMSMSDGFQVANVNKALGSVSKMVRNGNRVVFDTSGSYIENKMTNDVLWLRVRDGVFDVSDSLCLSMLGYISTHCLLISKLTRPRHFSQLTLTAPQAAKNLFDVTATLRQLARNQKKQPASL